MLKAIPEVFNGKLAWSRQTFSGAAPFPTTQPKGSSGALSSAEYYFEQPSEWVWWQHLLGLPLQDGVLGQLCAPLNANQAKPAFGTKSRALVLPAAPILHGRSEWIYRCRAWSLRLVSHFHSPYYSVLLLSSKTSLSPALSFRPQKTIFLAGSNGLENSSFQLQPWRPQPQTPWETTLEKGFLQILSEKTSGAIFDKFIALHFKETESVILF